MQGHDLTASSTGPNYLRPRQIAAKMGTSVETVYRRARVDPDFPPMIRMSQRCTVVNADELDAYMAKKAAATERS